MSELERVAYESALIETLSDLIVEVAGITNYSAQLTRAGAQAVVDRLRARGYKIER